MIGCFLFSELGAPAEFKLTIVKKGNPDGRMFNGKYNGGVIPSNNHTRVTVKHKVLFWYIQSQTAQKPSTSSPNVDDQRRSQHLQIMYLCCWINLDNAVVKFLLLKWTRFKLQQHKVLTRLIWQLSTQHLDLGINKSEQPWVILMTNRCSNCFIGEVTVHVSSAVRYDTLFKNCRGPLHALYPPQRSLPVPYFQHPLPPFPHPSTLFLHSPVSWPYPTSVCSLLSVSLGLPLLSTARKADSVRTQGKSL